jgi:hypothetical protein
MESKEAIALFNAANKYRQAINDRTEASDFVEASRKLQYLENAAIDLDYAIEEMESKIEKEKHQNN